MQVPNMSARAESLESYLGGRWVSGEGVETRLYDPVGGDYAEAELQQSEIRMAMTDRSFGPKLVEYRDRNAGPIESGLTLTPEDVRQLLHAGFPCTVPARFGARPGGRGGY